VERTEATTVEQIIGAMSAKGWRITEQRRTLATLFAGAGGYLAPKDVYEAMKESYPGVSFDTVYRNLRLLSEMGVLEQVYLNEGPKFRASCHSHHHHHLICVQCEKTVPLDYCPLPDPAALPGGYEILHHRFEVFGYCPDCAKLPHPEYTP
jgi:Fur family zinc uptake transcriptional regulator